MNKLIDRLENFYDFECEGGSLKNCVDWIQLKDKISQHAAAVRKPLEEEIKQLKQKLDEIKEDGERITQVYESQHFIAPPTLTEKELEVWNWLVGIFKETNNCRISDIDVHLMELYCKAKVATDEADSELKKDPRPYILVPLGKDKDGKIRTTTKPNPFMRIRTENAMLCLKYFDQLGLSPVARARAGIGSDNSNKGI